MTQVRFHKLRNYEYKTRRGLSEAQIKKKLEQQGWKVWRGGWLPTPQDLEDKYPNVKKKYTELHELLERDWQAVSDELRYLAAVHHGMPDYICYNTALKKWKWVECKLENEGPSTRQVLCFARLESMGFTVEVHKLSTSRRTRGRLEGKKVKVQEQDKKLTSFSTRRKTRRPRKASHPSARASHEPRTSPNTRTSSQTDEQAHA